MFLCGVNDCVVVGTERDVTIVCLVVVDASWSLGSPVKDDGCNAELYIRTCTLMQITQHYSQTWHC